MNYRSQSIELAKFHLGFEDFDDLRPVCSDVWPDGNRRKLFGAKPDVGGWRLVPDYEDLNVIRELEKMLGENLPTTYFFNLKEIVGRDSTESTNYPRIDGYVFHASASQRREALLKTLNKWEDETI